MTLISSKSYLKLSEITIDLQLDLIKKSRSTLNFTFYFNGFVNEPEVAAQLDSLSSIAEIDFYNEKIVHLLQHDAFSKLVMTKE